MDLRTRAAVSGLLLVLVLIPSLDAASSIYSSGPFGVALLTVRGPFIPDLFPKCKTTSTGPSPAGQVPPRNLFIAVPKESGKYPVIQLQHAFTMDTASYSQLLQHVASHGFIIVAPQMDQLALPDATREIAGAAAVLDWHQNNLAVTIKKLLPILTVVPDLAKFVLLGHSRGGKVAFGLAKGVCKSSVKFSAIAGFDPVDGTGPGQQTPPPILTNKQAGLNLTFPTLIVGAGLGPTSLFGLPACAPLGVSQDEFFFESRALAFHFVAPDYGHMDFLDDITSPLSYAICPRGPSRAPMRRFSGGILIAFLQGVLFQDYSSISSVLADPASQAPLKLNDPQLTGVLPNSTPSFDSHLAQTVSSF